MFHETTLSSRSDGSSPGFVAIGSRGGQPSATSCALPSVSIQALSFSDTVAQPASAASAIATTAKRSGRAMPAPSTLSASARISSVSRALSAENAGVVLTV
jgi:hypothetical protein